VTARHLPGRRHFSAPGRNEDCQGEAPSAGVLLVLWLVCLWLYRRKIFLRI
jgi:hypothetical protein